ncbi:MAG: hypothetical protein ABRQ27_05465 [Clostridiaceae bacterium]
MLKVKLPGSKSFKRVLLGVLILVIIGILVKQGIDNKEASDKQNKIEEQIKADEEKALQEKAKQEAEAASSQKALDVKTEEARNIFYSKDYSGAIKLCNEVLKEDSSNYKAYNVRGIAKAYSGDFRGGMKDIDKALEISPDYGYARFNKALNYELHGYFEEALYWYDRALESEKYVWSYYGIASIYGRRGDIENTVKYLKMAIELDPAVKETAEDEHDFDPVRTSDKFNNLIK